MKLRNLLLLFALLVFGNQSGTAQRLPQERTYLALQGEYKLGAEKPLLEPNEFTYIHVKIDLLVLSQYKHIPLEPGAPTEQNLLPEYEDEFPWKIENWKILEGGGTLRPDSSMVQRYQAPAHAPPNNLITVSVDLNPKRKDYPKIILLQTLYFNESENAFYLDFPEIGAVGSKYISKTDAGVKVPTMAGVDPRVAARMSPEVRAQMAAANAQMAAAQAQSGINLSAVTSNAMALYDEQNNFTAVKFTKLVLQYNNRRIAAPSKGNAFLSFDFKGKGVGTYDLNDSTTGLGFMLNIVPPSGVGCGKSNGGAEMPCDGTIEITSVDDKTIKGKITSHVYTLIGKEIYSGYFYGKFTVNRAN